MAVENTSRERFGYTDVEGNQVSALRDMLDGGGRGQRGNRFEGGGLLSSFGNALGGPGGRARGQGFGYTDADGNVVSPGIDMINGGGRGMAGSQFQGGLLSAVLNSLGVRPYGYVDPEEAVTANMDQTAPSLMASPAAVTRPTMRPPQLNTAPVNSAHTLTQQDIADLEAYLSGQPTVMATSPMLSVPAMTSSRMTMPQPDRGIISPLPPRPSSRIPPMQGFLPVKTDIRPPRPAPPGMATPPNAGVAAANQAYLEMLRRAAESGNPIRPAASMLPR